jgi:hypothetical protein
MGQFGNQPDFATSNIQEITPNDTITNQYFLNGAVIYIGDNTTTGTHMKVIPAGTVGPSVVTALSSPGYAGSGGTGYTAANNVVTTTTGSGTALTVNTTVAGGAVTSIVIGNNAGTGYLNGDLITVTGGGANAVFRIVAAPGLPTAAQAVTFKGLQAGGFLPVTVDYVLATGTTVAELIAAK